MGRSCGRRWSIAMGKFALSQRPQPIRPRSGPAARPLPKQRHTRPMPSAWTACPLSTARLYTFTQPGHSLWSLGQSNPFDPEALAPTSGHGGGNRLIAGGLIFFGGGVPLYSNGKIVGGLGVSGDTSCADHEIAKRVRHLANLDPASGPTADDITYSAPMARASSRIRNASRPTATASHWATNRYPADTEVYLRTGGSVCPGLNPPGRFAPQTEPAH